MPSRTSYDRNCDERTEEVRLAEKKLLCVFTTLLGHQTVVKRFTYALNRLPGIEPTYVLVEPEDYRRRDAPRWARWTNPWYGAFVARQKAAPVIKQRFDMLLVNAWEFAVAFRDVARRMPAAAAMDCVPATSYAQHRQNGSDGVKRWLSHQVYHRSFARAAREFDFFLPKGTDCARALQQQYGVASERCFVTLAPQHLDTWKPLPRNSPGPLRLLFVGNDFARKGGDFLLRLFSNYLAGTCTLTIASNDPALATLPLPQGVQWLPGRSRDELLPVYREHDVFVFPTHRDFTPEVLAEALAVGLPCLASDVDGVRDLIQDGVNGFAMPRQASMALWAARVLRLAADRAELKRISESARRFAEDNLAFDRFQTLLADVVGRLREQPHRVCNLDLGLSARMAR